MIYVEDLSVKQGDFSLDKVSFEVASGQYAILMGRTGSGKTTILESICGLKPLAGGRITLMGRDVTRLKPAERNIGFVPQEGALFSSLTVREQIGFALTIRKWRRDQISKRVIELAEMLSLGHLLDRRPNGLSGGEIQRVALGRALAARPGVLCLDEPLSALDDATREEMYELLKSVRDHEDVTTLHITHSKIDARRLADTVFWINDGTVQRLSIDDLETTADLSNGDSEKSGAGRGQHSRPQCSDTPKTETANDAVAEEVEATRLN